MASFIPNGLTDPTKVRNFTGYSKNPSPADYQDTALGRAIGGVGSILKAGVTAADENIKNNIQEDVTQGKDVKLAEAGVPEAILPAGVSGPEDLYKGDPSLFPKEAPSAPAAPKEVEAYKKVTNKLQAQRNAGVISETAYIASVEKLTREVRARYPGYREEVDRVIKQQFGFDPANALRRARLAEELKAQNTSAKRAEAEEKKRVAFVLSNAQHLDPSTFSEIAAGNYQNLNKAMNTIQRNLVDNERVRQEAERYKRDKTIGSDNAKSTATTMAQSAAEEANKVIWGPKSHPIIAKILANQQLTPEEMREGSAYINLQLQSAESKIRQAITTGEGAKHLSPSEIDDRVKIAIQPIVALKKAFDDKNFGAIALFKTINDAKNNEALAKLYGTEKGKALKNFNLILSTMPPQIAAIFIGKNWDDVLTTVPKFKDLARVLAVQAAMGNGKAVADALNEQKAEAQAAVYEAINKLISLKEVPDFVKKNLRVLMTNTVALSKVSSKFKSTAAGKKFYDMFTAPEVVQTAKTLPPKEREAYYNGLVLATNRLIRTPLNDAMKAVKVATSGQYEGITVVYDPKSASLKYLIPKSVKDKRLGIRGLTPPENGIPSGLGTLNSFIQKLKDVSDGDDNRFKDLIQRTFQGNLQPIGKIILDGIAGPAPKSQKGAANSNGNFPQVSLASLAKELDGKILGFAPIGVMATKDAAAGSASDAINRTISGVAQGVKKSVTVGNVTYDNAGKIRNKRLQPALEKTLSSVAGEMGFKISVFSGGQDHKGHGHRRTGSTRHDGGRAADIELIGKDNRVLSFFNPGDREEIADFVTRLVAAGYPGIGAGPGYMGNTGTKIHVGGGSSLTWGAGGRSRNAPSWLRTAHTRGLMLRNSNRRVASR